MQLAKTLSLGLRDIFSPQVMLFVLKIGFASITIWVGFLSIYWDETLGVVASYLGVVPWEWLRTTGSVIATLIVAYVLIITTISILTSLLSENLLKKLAQKHYGIEADGHPSLTQSLRITLQANALFLFLFVFLFWVIFIPIIGQIFMLYLWSIQLKNPTIYDVGTLFMDEGEYLKSKAKKARLLAIIPSFFNYIPILNIFAPIYAQILFLHHILHDA